MGNMAFYTLEEVKDELMGKVGTPERDEYEQKLKEEIHAYHVGEAIKQARISRNLTQEQLGERIGVQKAQISRLERGKSITLSTMVRVFKAMDITATLDLGTSGKVVLG